MGIRGPELKPLSIKGFRLLGAKNRGKRAPSVTHGSKPRFKLIHHLKKRHFFITGLPRSRTAWLANLLTNGDCLCLHGGLLEVGGDVKLLPAWLDMKPHPIVGNSDPSMLFYPTLEQIRETFPEAHWAFIVQDPSRAWKRHAKAFPEINVSLELFHELRDRIDQALRDIPKPQTICIQEDELNNYIVCDKIVRHCTGRYLILERWKILEKMRVTAMKEKWIAGLPTETLAKIAAVVS